MSRSSSIPTADTVLTNATVITVDTEFSTAEAVAVAGDRIIAVGTHDEVMRLAGPETRVIDLGGRPVLPGFIDTHAHIGLFGQEKLWVNLDGASTVAEICARIGAAAADKPAGEVIMATPVGDHPYFFNVPQVIEEGRFPTRQELDAVAPDHPVYITAPTNRVPNSAVFNTLALRLAGLLDEVVPDDAENVKVTPDAYWLDGIEVVRDPATGIPTGEIRYMQPVYNPSRFYQRITPFLPAPGYESIREGIRLMAPDFYATGTTTLLENHLTRPEEARAYADLKLPLRVFFTHEIDPRLPLDQIERMLSMIAWSGGEGFGNDRFGFTGVSIGVDGPHWHGAGVADEPYVGPYGDMIDPGPIVPEELYREIVRLAAGYGLRVHSCGGGRRAIQIVLDAFAAADRESSIADRRFVLEHCEFPTREQIAECKRLGVIPTTTTNFLWGKVSEVFVDRLGGGDYSENSIPFRWWLDAGIPVAQETDWGPHEVMFSIWQSIARQSGLTGEVIGAHQRVTREEAIRMFTNNGAYVLFKEDDLGSVEVGKLADLIVLSDNPLTCVEDDIKDIQVLATMIGGKAVHGHALLKESGE
ncbi:amidohydrolase [Rhizohabitans arisaemae]|uniref:amidohydrolase n=1 Tax=Rhizohabitans arisaemae TaxID=2720610 RepID=UPI0024B15E6A|nr:amidohydrolase [Rhizohabitans arisaemae]